jgi:hypothetical protein
MQQAAVAVGDGYVYEAGKVSPNFIADVLKTLIGSFVGAGLAFIFAIRKDSLNRIRDQKAAGNMASLTLTRLANDFLQAKTYLVEYQKYLDRVQPHSPLWMQLKALHFNHADVKFDLPSIVFLLEHTGGAPVVEKLITVEMKVHDFFSQIAVHAQANYELQQKLSESTIDPRVGGSIAELNRVGGFALIAKVESFVKGINLHLQNTEPAIRAAAFAMPALMVKIFGDKGTIKIDLPSHEELVQVLDIKFSEGESTGSL